ncbi:MAG: ATP-binding protein [Caldisericaceae bacterium]
MIEKITYDIPNIHQVIKLLANVYSDPRDALTEFLINSLDASAENINIIVEKGKINRVLIKDDGFGMDNEEMHRIIKNIGNSIKVNPDELRKRKINSEQVIGHMGIGILGYQSFCKKVVFISKSQSSLLGSWKMTLESNKEDAIVEEASFSEENLLLNRENGTTAVLYEVDHEIMKLFSFLFLKQYLEKNLSGILRRRRDLKITLSDTVSEVVLEPLAFSGIPFSKTSLSTKSGKLVKLDIYIQPTGANDDVRISTKGKVVVKEIIRLPEFQHSPWVEGILHGLIEANFLEVAPTRADYLRNTLFNEFVDSLTEIEDALNQEIENAKEESDAEKREELIKRLNRAVSKALVEMSFEGAKVDVSDSKGKLVMGKLDGSPPPVNHTLNPRKEKHSKINTDEKETPIRSRSRGGLNLKWDHLGNPNLHSVLREGGLIIINEDAEDYKSECINSNVNKELRYLSKLVAKELSKFNNPLADADDVMENAIALEIRILKYLNL